MSRRWGRKKRWKLESKLKEAEGHVVEAAQLGKELGRRLEIKEDMYREVIDNIREFARHSSFAPPQQWAMRGRRDGRHYISIDGSSGHSFRRVMPTDAAHMDMEFHSKVLYFLEVEVRRHVDLEREFSDLLHLYVKFDGERVVYALTPEALKHSAEPEGLLKHVARELLDKIREVYK